MSTSGSFARVAPSPARIFLRYLAVVAFCLLFNAIYAQFAHGVSSPFMTFMFIIPLAAGAAAAFAARATIRPAPVVARQAWALATACLTVASCLHGIFDIAGTASPYLVVYLAAALVFAGIAAAAFLRAR